MKQENFDSVTRQIKFVNVLPLKTQELIFLPAAHPPPPTLPDVWVGLSKIDGCDSKLPKLRFECLENLKRKKIKHR